MDLTRRGLLGRALAASGAALGGSLLTPSTVFAGANGEAVFEARVPRGQTADGIWRSGIISPARPFELVGVGPAARRADGREPPQRGGAAPDHVIELRARASDGRWSKWIRPSSCSGSAPVWLGPSDALEIRAPRSLAGARLVLVDSGRPASASAGQHYVDAGLPAAAGQPRVIARSSWATRACRPRVPAVFGAVELAFVHHTVSSNYYRRSQSAAMVRSICLFHKYGNGWNDIGYNFVVDRYGQIFEAREGGIDEAIVGAQAGGYNAFSSGVALLGTFSGSGPGRATFNSLAQLLAWKLAIHGVEVPGRVTVRVTRDGSGYSRYRAGAAVHLNTIAGHRDADTTECPGSGMYRQLPRLRQAVTRQLGTVTQLTAMVQAIAPGNATIGGLLANADGPISAATIELQRHSSTAPPTTLGTATTNPDGTWALGVPLATNAQLRAVYRGGAAAAAAVSASVAVAVPPQITLNAVTQTTIAGGVIEFDGFTAPAKPRVTIVVALQQPDGSFSPVRSFRTGTDSDGSFSRSIGFPDPGQYQVIAHTPADASNALGTSPPLTITVA